MSKMGLMAATESTNHILEALVKAKAASLKGLKFKRSAWDVVRRKKTPDQRAAKLVRISSKWNSRFDVNKVDIQKLAASLEGISEMINKSVSVGLTESVSAASGLTAGTVKAVGKAAYQVGPQPAIELSGQFADLEDGN